jgi:hypothetical protein
MRKTIKQVRPEDFDVEALMVAAREGRLYIEECIQRGRLSLCMETKNKELRKKRRPVVWEDDSPMTKLIDMSQFDRLRTILTEWQAYSNTTIIPKRTTHFEFDIAYRKTIVLALKDGWDGDVPLFLVSQRQVLKYLSVHSNLGKLDTLKKILYRNK